MKHNLTIFSSFFQQNVCKKFLEPPFKNQLVVLKTLTRVWKESAEKLEALQYCCLNVKYEKGAKFY
jgi:hypothetical protein